MRSQNLFVRCSGNDVARLESEYFALGRFTQRVEGGLSVAAITPDIKKDKHGEWVWVLSKPSKKKPERRDSNRRDDETAPPKTNPREQRPKRS